MDFRSAEIAPIGREGLSIVNTGKWRKERPVMDLEKCIKCGICFLYCPVYAVKKQENGDFIITYDYCKGCGICEHECPKNAIEMIEEEVK